MIVPFHLQFWLMWFHKKTSRQVFHSNKHKCVKINFLLKSDFHLEDNCFYAGDLCIKIHFICLSNARWNQRKIAFKIIQNVPPPPPTHSVLSPIHIYSHNTIFDLQCKSYWILNKFLIQNSTKSKLNVLGN